MDKKDFFEYNNGEEVTKGAFRISASQLSKFFDQTSAWYHENLLGEEGFTGSTASMLGTVVHAGIEMYVTSGEVDYEALEDRVLSIDDEEIDTGRILSQYQHMIDAALPYVDNNMPEEVEKFIFHELLPGIGAGGSLDAIKGLKDPHGATIMDWKTTSSKTAPVKFSRNYWFQQMCYAWVLKQQGVNVRYIKLVYITASDVNRVSEKTGKQLKDYPSIVTEVVEEVTDSGLELIGSCLQVVADSVKTWNDQPELRYLLAQDGRLRPTKKPVLFKTGN
jgi:hypothetical protein